MGEKTHKQTLGSVNGDNWLSVSLPPTNQTTEGNWQDSIHFRFDLNTIQHAVLRYSGCNKLNAGRYFPAPSKPKWHSDFQLVIFRVVKSRKYCRFLIWQVLVVLVAGHMQNRRTHGRHVAPGTGGSLNYVPSLFPLAHSPHQQPSDPTCPSQTACTDVTAGTFQICESGTLCESMLSHLQMWNMKLLTSSLTMSVVPPSEIHLPAKAHLFSALAKDRAAQRKPANHHSCHKPFELNLPMLGVIFDNTLGA